MKYDNLFYPKFFIEIGEYEINQAVEAKVIAAKSKPIAIAKIKLNEEIRQVVEIKNGDSVRIWLGYKNDFFQIFAGEIVDGREEIIAKDMAYKLSKIKVNKNFRKASQKDILLYLLKQAKIKDFKITVENNALQHYLCADKSGIEAIRQMQSEYGDLQDFYCLDETFYYGRTPIKKNHYFLDHGKNIISLRKTAKNWEIETIYLPDITHSQKVYIDHPRLLGEYEIKEIVYIITEDGFLKIKIRGEYENVE